VGWPIADDESNDKHIRLNSVTGVLDLFFNQPLKKGYFFVRSLLIVVVSGHLSQMLLACRLSFRTRNLTQTITTLPRSCHLNAATPLISAPARRWFSDKPKERPFDEESLKAHASEIEQIKTRLEGARDDVVKRKKDFETKMVRKFHIIFVLILDIFGTKFRAFSHHPARSWFILSIRLLYKRALAGRAPPRKLLTCGC
jgi:hypothetical protein